MFLLGAVSIMNTHRCETGDYQTADGSCPQIPPRRMALNILSPFHPRYPEHQAGTSDLYNLPGHFGR